MDLTKLIELASANNGIIRTKQVVDAKIAKDYITRAVSERVLERIDHGVYLLSGTIPDDYFLLQIKRSRIVFSHTTSAYLNHLTTRDPIMLSFTVPLKYNVTELAGEGHKVYFSLPKNYNLGIIETKTMFGNPIRIYDAERTICDLFSARSEEDPYIALESLKTYLTSKEKDIFKLTEYAKQLGVEKTIRKKVEAMSI